MGGLQIGMGCRWSEVQILSPRPLLKTASYNDIDESFDLLLNPFKYASLL